MAATMATLPPNRVDLLLFSLLPPLRRSLSLLSAAVVVAPKEDMMIFALLLPAAFVCFEETKILEKEKTRRSLGCVTNPKSCASVQFSFHRVHIKKAACCPSLSEG